MKKKIVSIMLAVIMIVVMIPLGAIPAFAESAGSVSTIEITGNFSMSDASFSDEYEGCVFQILTNNEATVTLENIMITDIDHTSIRIEHDDEYDAKLTVNFINCRFINCGDEDDGLGGIVQIFGDGNTEVNFFNCIAYGCKAYKGGFLYCENENAQINGHNSTICHSCYASEDGGAVYLWNAAGIDGFAFIENYAENEGGAIYNQCNNDSTGYMVNCGFYENHAEIGGAIWARNDVSKCGNALSVSNCRVYNSGDQSGYDVYFDKFCYADLTFYCDSSYDVSEKHISGVFAGSDPNYFLISNMTLQADSLGVYHIRNPYDWDCFCSDVLNGRHNGFENQIVRLEADVSAWKFIGSYNSGGETKQAFKGTFDGLGHFVSIVNVNDWSNVGVFSSIDRATVRNLNVNGYIVGNWSLAGVAGHSYASTISNCKNHALIKQLGINGADGWFAGGIVGCAAGDTVIENCENFACITALENAGGIVGILDNALVNNCRNFGEEIRASYNAGGIAGTVGSGSCMMNCTNRGFIFGLAEVGGLAGSVAENGEIYNSIAAPSHVTGSLVLAGGFAGNNEGDIFNCLFGGSVTTGNIPSTDFTGSNSGRVERCYIYGQLNLNETYFNRTIDENLCGVESTDGWYRWVKNNDNYELVRSYNYTYSDYDADTHVLVDAQLPISVAVTEYTGETVMGQEDAETWYVAKQNVTQADRVTVKGHVHLILVNGVKLDFQKGICLNAGNTLSVHSEYKDAPSGTLRASVPDYQNVWERHAAIGSNEESNAGTLNVYGGDITAHSFWAAAAIGGGCEGNGGTVNVYGGNLSADSVLYGRAIGAGRYAKQNGQLNVYGGIISINDGEEPIGSTSLNIVRYDCFDDIILKFDDVESTIDQYTGQNRIFIDARPAQIFKKHVYGSTVAGNPALTNPETGEVIPGWHTYYQCDCGHCFASYDTETGELSGEITDIEYWKTHEGKRTDAKSHTVTFDIYPRYVDDGECLPREYIPKPTGYIGMVTLGWTYTKDGKVYFFDETVPVTENMTLIPAYKSEAKTRTCTQDGCLEYYKLGYKYYKNADFTDEISDIRSWKETSVEDGGGIMFATGHDCEYTVSYDKSTGIYSATEQCKNCDYSDSYTFTPYDYIAVSRGAYIDTGYKPTEKTRVVMDVYVNGALEYWFGVWDIDYNKSAFALGNDNGGIYAGYGNQGGTDSSGSLSNGYHTVEMNKNKVYFDGVHYTGIAHTESSDGFPIQNTLYLFAQNRKGSATAYAEQGIIHCYGCEIYDGNTLVRKFVPGKKNDGTVGLLDVQSGKFYGNGSSSASMTALNDANETVSCVDPSCTENGSLEYYKTRAKLYIDENHIEEITDLETWLNTSVANGGGLIPATGHTWECVDGIKHKCSVCQAEEAHTDDGTGICEGCGCEISEKIYTVTLTNTETSEVVYSELMDCTNGCVIENIANGTYVMAVSCNGTVTRTYPVEVTEGKVSQDVELYIEGDVNGDGTVDINDYQQCVNIALDDEAKINEDLTEDEDYMKAVADLDCDGYVDVLDVVLLERKTKWTVA